MECVHRSENMGPGPRSAALRGSVVMFALTLTAALVMAQLGVASVWRLGLFPPFFMAVYGASVALTGTCGFTAMRGMRNIDREERIADSDTLRETRRAGLRLFVTGVGTALALTLGLVVV